MKKILKKWKRFFFLSIFIGSIGFWKLAPLYSRYFPEKGISKPIPKVKTHLAFLEQESRSIPIFGILEPGEIEEVSPKYSGIIEKFFVEEGDTVQKGQPLFKMGTSFLKLEIEKQKMALKIAEAQVKIQREKIKKVKKIFLTKVLEYKKIKNLEAKSILETDRSVSLLTLKTELFKEGIISAEELKSSGFEKKSREILQKNSELETEIASIPLQYGYQPDFISKLDKTYAESTASEESELLASESQLRLATQQLILLEEQLKSSLICSPIAGRILKKRKNQGEFISLNSNSIISIGVIHNLRAVFTLGEIDSFKIKKGFSIKIQTDVVENREWKGSITSVNPLFEDKIFSSKIRADLDNSDYVLHPGNYFKGKVFLEESESYIYLPENALFLGEYVYVLEGDLAKRRKIQYSLAGENKIKIISGLKENEEVILKGTEDIQDGVRVLRED